MSLKDVPKQVWPVFQKHANMGAMDSEPLYKLEAILRRCI